MRRKVKSVLHTKLKNRRVSLFKIDGGYGISTKALFKNWEGKKIIWKESIALTDEAMTEVVSMWHTMELAEKRRHLWPEEAQE